MMRKFCSLFSTLFLLAIAIGFMILPLASVEAASPPGTTSPSPVPAAPTPAATPPAAAATKSAPAPSGPVRTKLIDATDVSTSSLSKGGIDVYMSLTNNGKLDDALVNAETVLSDKLTLVTVKDKKETEGALHVDLPMGKKIKLSEDDKFLRISGIEKSLKDGDKFQLILHFMRAPNVTVDVTVHKKSSFF